MATVVRRVDDRLARIVPVSARIDVDRARREARAVAAAAGFDRADAERVALAASELASNLFRYARDGTIAVAPVRGERGVGVAVESRDAGPGIADLEWALRDGTSTGGGLGSGLPGVRRLVDEFAIATEPEGTTIEARVWPGRR